MYLYSILKTHLRPWTIHELIFWGLMLAVVLVVILLFYKRRKLCPSQAVAAALGVCYLIIVLASTVFTRLPEASREYELRLFWSWKEVLRNGNRVLLEENLLNLCLLFPLGLLLPLLLQKNIAWWKGLLLGCLISAGIELSQLLFARGLFEWDDIVHNGIGYMAGCVISSFIFFRISKKFR